MGYCYDKNGRLCCDSCGAAPAVKVPCPFNSCPSMALCRACKEKHRDKQSREFHRAHGCERNHLEYVRQIEERRALLASGRALRCSALGVPRGVHVLFESLRGTVGYFMSEETYRALPLGVNATVEDFAAHGALEPAPASFYA